MSTVSAILVLGLSQVLLTYSSMSHTTFYSIVHKYVSPAIKSQWFTERNNNIDSLKNGSVWLAGDGQFDSPGYSAKYVTYTFMDVHRDKIIDFIVLQKGQISGDLEKPACDKLLSRLLEEGVNIELFLSDRHRGVRKLLRTKFSNICHEFDVWHLAKSLGKKLKEIGKKAPLLQNWKNSIINHLWWSCQTCGGDEAVLIEKFQSVLYHICNVHEWPGNEVFHRCEHGEITEDISWIKENSHDYRLLELVIKYKSFIADLRQAKNYCHTGSLESYHNVAIDKLGTGLGGKVIMDLLALIKNP